MVRNVPSPFNTVAAMVSAEKLYPELRSSSDMHLAALHNFPSNISPAGLVYLQGTIPNRVSQLHPLDPVWSQYSRILQWQSARSASHTYRSKYTYAVHTANR